MSLLELFIDVDDFCQVFLPIWQKRLLGEGSKKRIRNAQLSLSEIMTIIIYFHQSRYCNFKSYYLEHVYQHLRAEFPNLVSYERFVVLMPSAFGLLSAYLKSLYGKCSGISFVDSTALAICDNHRIHNHKVFEGGSRARKRLDGLVLWPEITLGRQCLDKLDNPIAAKSYLDKSPRAIRMIANQSQFFAKSCLAS